jgi:hypothetical protein
MRASAFMCMSGSVCIHRSIAYQAHTVSHCWLVSVGTVVFGTANSGIHLTTQLHTFPRKGVKSVRTHVYVLNVSTFFFTAAQLLQPAIKRWINVITRSITSTKHYIIRKSSKQPTKIVHVQIVHQSLNSNVKTLLYNFRSNERPAKGFTDITASLNNA